MGVFQLHLGSVLPVLWARSAACEFGSRIPPSKHNMIPGKSKARERVASIASLTRMPRDSEVETKQTTVHTATAMAVGKAVGRAVTNAIASAADTTTAITAAVTTNTLPSAPA